MGRAAPLAVSVGVAGWESGMAAAGLVARADAKLYEAKRAGRNRVRGTRCGRRRSNADAGGKAKRPVRGKTDKMKATTMKRTRKTPRTAKSAR